MSTKAVPTIEEQGAYLAAQRRGYELAAREQRRRISNLAYKANLAFLDALLDMALPSTSAAADERVRRTAPTSAASRGPT